ncbi:hypothetical protein [Mammaliicoccus sciuri]|uniref:hypothetical protein n=1 Tax=Mammaliicoccus sciuri TaxID=1296 RepID=UPI000EE0BD1C|nr:hypothetical protein [Mammaliicoccus sciuri]HCW36800.1 hypothetical protein [Staphylococcus sp.]MCJ0909781.1 hypothetical protein [Mammaliicoccus sciuri]MCJ0922239.1 hypothetical protein [Mammaliicoccus sciuri]MCJ0925277.1 hypothetical protein [Mammaliicoccus sciuri]MCJ1761606.1 hypothetical protein [Mammaliicoccus sciuri]
MEINRNILYRFEPSIDKGTGYIFFKDSKECLKVGKAIIDIIREIERNHSLELLNDEITNHDSFSNTITKLMEIKVII